MEEGGEEEGGKGNLVVLISNYRQVEYRRVEENNTDHTELERTWSFSPLLDERSHIPSVIITARVPRVKSSADVSALISSFISSILRRIVSLERV